MSAYIIARVEVTDWPRYKEYMKITPDLITRFGGKFIARGGEMVTLEGPEETRRVVIIEFPSIDEAKAFYHSNEYQYARTLREGGANAQFVVLAGEQSPE